MIWIIIILFSLLTGIFIGALIMYFRDRHLLNNQKILYNELQNNKNKLNEYQKKISNHFNQNIELLNKISENYRHLYQNMTKNANFFLTHTINSENVQTCHLQDSYKKNEEPLLMEVPKDYSDNTEGFQKKL